MSDGVATSPLRVAMVARRVHPAHGPGGLERHVYDLVTRLADSEIEVDLFAEPPSSVRRTAALAAAMPGRVVVHWVEGRWLPFGSRSGTVVLDRITNYPAWALRVKRWMMALRDGAGKQDGGRGGWSLVHAHGLAGWGLARAARRARLFAPLLLSPHGMEEFQVPAGPKRWAYAPFRACMRTVAAASTCVVAMDPSLQPLIDRYLGVPPSRQTIIPNAVDPEACRKRADPQRGRRLLAQLGLEGASPLFLSVGRVAPNKGYGLMAAALATAGPRLPTSWAWVLVGDGPDRARVQDLAAAAGLSSRCGFPGTVPNRDLHSFYTVADWFVHPTLYEGSSIATLEAMAHGLPVIASRAGGLPDKVKDGVTGYLAEPGQPVALAEALVRSSGADAAALGRAGQQECEARFSWKAVTPQYVALYRRLASQGPGG